ncbi:hypothetical protein FOL47_006490 [Perkinsus chesapeaki]|uniref:Uncharacterized protein n=1 Tax=Perkinsus chesapeaki TaxID=330153 RepID=A0A7J6LRI9_PERCH|nr:hypothetical protein FOL47_006490 [Perkinsus chesapeaki]
MTITALLTVIICSVLIVGGAAVDKESIHQDPSVLGGDVKEFEKSSVDRLAHVFHEAASSVIPNNSAPAAASQSLSFASLPNSMDSDTESNMKNLYAVILLCMAFIAALFCVRIYRSDVRRRGRGRGDGRNNEMSKSLMQYPTNTTDAGDDVAYCDMYTHHNAPSEQEHHAEAGGKGDLLKAVAVPGHHIGLSTPPQPNKKRPLAATEEGILDIDFKNTTLTGAAAATPSTAATSRFMGDSVLRGDPRSVRLFREDSTASSIGPMQQTPEFLSKRLLPPLSEALSPLPKLQAAAMTPTGSHSLYVPSARFVEEEETAAPVTPQRKPGSSRRSRSPSPPKIDKYRSRCRPMPCDGIQPRRLFTEFQLMMEEGEVQQEQQQDDDEHPVVYPALVELPRLTFLYSDEEDSDEDLISPGSRLPRMPRITESSSAVNTERSSARSTTVPEELEGGSGSSTPTTSAGEGHSMSLKESLVADLEALFLEMDQYQMPLRIAGRNLRTRSAQYAEVEDMERMLQELIQEHPRQFRLDGGIIHFIAVE